MNVTFSPTVCILTETSISTRNTNDIIGDNAVRQTNILWGTLSVSALSLLVSIASVWITYSKKTDIAEVRITLKNIDTLSPQKQKMRLQIKIDSTYSKEAKKTLPKKKGG